MYQHDRIGPWPFTDIGYFVEQSVTYESSSGVYLLPYLPITALGSRSYASSNALLTGSDPISTGENLTFGLGLEPLNQVNYTEDPIMIEFSGSIVVDVSTDIQPFLFAGFADADTLNVGFDAGNLMSKFTMLPGLRYGGAQGVSWNTQFLYGPVNTNFVRDLPLIVGVGYVGVAAGAGTVANCRLSMSARYSLQQVDTQDKING